MKTVYIIHGWQGSPQENWFPWLKDKLEENTFSVEAPQMPDPMEPKQDEWVNHLNNVVKDPSEDTILVGHSLGGITILRYLESLPEGTKVGKVVLVAAFPESIGKEALENFFLTPLNYPKIRKSVNEIVAFQSENDPYVPFRNGETLRDLLGAKLISVPQAGHFNEKSGYTAFPDLLEEIL